MVQGAEKRDEERVSRILMIGWREDWKGVATVFRVKIEV